MFSLVLLQAKAGGRYAHKGVPYIHEKMFSLVLLQAKAGGKKLAGRDTLAHRFH